MNSMEFSNQRYESLRDIFKDQRLPLAFVDLDSFDANVDTAARISQAAGKRLRIGTKSVRCLALLERVLAHASASFRGFLTFTAEETAFLAERGDDDFILAYPTVQPSDMEILAQLTKQGKQVSVMVDNPQHLNKGKYDGAPRLIGLYPLKAQVGWPLVLTTAPSKSMVISNSPRD